ncbi:MAG: HEAT repeat domain-containing protein [Promethearchaeia archaeon]
MENNEEWFQKVKENRDPTDINNFIIHLSEEVKKEHLSYVKYLVENLSEKKLKKININLVFLIGELIKEGYGDEQLMDYLFNSYYKSDVWIRREILKSICKIGEAEGLSKIWRPLLQSALRENDMEIRQTAIEAMTYLNILTPKLFKSFLYAINQATQEETEQISDVLSQHIPTNDKLFALLDKNQNYKVLDKKGIRTLLMTFFESVINLEPFRKKVEKAEWEKKGKQKVINEIDVMEKILLQNI